MAIRGRYRVLTFILAFGLLIVGLRRYDGGSTRGYTKLGNLQLSPSDVVIYEDAVHDGGLKSIGIVH